MKRLRFNSEEGRSDNSEIQGEKDVRSRSESKRSFKRKAEIEQILSKREKNKQEEIDSSNVNHKENLYLFRYKIEFMRDVKHVTECVLIFTLFYCALVKHNVLSYLYFVTGCLMTLSYLSLYDVRRVSFL